MGKHKRTGRSDLLEWQICDDEAAWQASQEKKHAEVPPSAALISHKQPSSWQQQGQKWGLVLVAMTLLIFAAGLAWVQAQLGLATIEREVRNAVELDARTLDARTLDVGTMDMSGREHPARQKFTPPSVHEAEVVDVGNGWARVRVIVQGENESLYRQTRIYQERNGQQGTEWVRVLPTISNWGHPRQWESTYFHFDYYSQDEEAVKAAAPKLDALYPTFYTALRAGKPPSQKVIVKVDPTATIVPSYKATSAGDASLILPSPSATLAPVAVSEESLLVQGVALALFNRLAMQSESFHQLPPGWKLLQSGLRLWLLWDQELPLARWREPLVHLVFSTDEVVPMAEKSVSVSAFAHDFCGHHRLWLNSEAEIDSPVLCIQHVMGREATLALRYTPPPIMLSYFVGREDLLALAMPNVSGDQILPTASAVFFATLFEYISAEYDTEKVSMLVTAIPHHQSWETLIPDIFGVSRREFEISYNTFLAKRYGLVP